jgi:hypothetical protein
MTRQRVTEACLATRFQATVEATGIVDAWDHFLDFCESGNSWDSSILGNTADRAVELWLTDYNRSDDDIAREYHAEVRQRVKRSKVKSKLRYQTSTYSKWNKRNGPNGGAVQQWRTISDGKEYQPKCYDVVAVLGRC